MQLCEPASGQSASSQPAKEKNGRPAKEKLELSSGLDDSEHELDQLVIKTSAALLKGNMRPPSEELETEIGRNECDTDKHNQSPVAATQVVPESKVNGSISPRDDDEKSELELNRLLRPKRPMNAFMVWGQSIRRELHNRYTNVQNSKLSKALGRVWRQFDSEQRRPYIERANEIKANHKRYYPGYRYQPRRIQEKQYRQQQLREEEQQQQQQQQKQQQQQQQQQAHQQRKHLQQPVLSQPEQQQQGPRQQQQQQLPPVSRAEQKKSASPSADQAQNRLQMTIAADASIESTFPEARNDHDAGEQVCLSNAYSVPLDKFVTGGAQCGQTEMLYQLQRDETTSVLYYNQPGGDQTSFHSHTDHQPTNHLQQQDHHHHHHHHLHHQQQPAVYLHHQQTYGQQLVMYRENDYSQHTKYYGPAEETGVSSINVGLQHEQQLHHHHHHQGSHDQQQQQHQSSQPQLFEYQPRTACFGVIHCDSKDVQPQEEMCPAHS